MSQDIEKINREIARNLMNGYEYICESEGEYFADQWIDSLSKEQIDILREQANKGSPKAVSKIIQGTGARNAQRWIDQNVEKGTQKALKRPIEKWSTSDLQNQYNKAKDASSKMKGELDKNKNSGQYGPVRDQDALEYKPGEWAQKISPADKLRNAKTVVPVPSNRYGMQPDRSVKIPTVKEPVMRNNKIEIEEDSETERMIDQLSPKAVLPDGTRRNATPEELRRHHKSPSGNRDETPEQMYDRLKQKSVSNNSRPNLGRDSGESDSGERLPQLNKQQIIDRLKPRSSSMQKSEPKTPELNKQQIIDRLKPRGSSSRSSAPSGSSGSPINDIIKGKGGINEEPMSAQSQVRPSPLVSSAAAELSKRFKNTKPGSSIPSRMPQVSPSEPSIPSRMPQVSPSGPSIPSRMPQISNIPNTGNQRVVPSLSVKKPNAPSNPTLREALEAAKIILQNKKLV